MKIYLYRCISGLAATWLLLIPFPLLAGDDSHIEIISEDVSPAWTQVHFEVGRGSWATFNLDDKADNITSLSFAIDGKQFNVPKPCFDDIHYPVLETAKLWFWHGGAALQFKTTTFDENGGGQDEKDMDIVRFTVQDGVLIERKITQEKDNMDKSWAVIDLSKGIKQSDVNAGSCGTPVIHHMEVYKQPGS